MELKTLRFLYDAANLLVGAPGVGKTMLSIRLDWAIIDAGQKMHCTTASDLAGLRRQLRSTGG